MALRKPSDLFNKKETSGVFESTEVSSHITESYDKFRDNFEKVNELSEKIEVLSQELSEKLTKSDLENAMLSQLMVLDENFKSLQNQVKGLNKQDLKEFKETVSNLSEIVDNLVETELPKYKKQITKNELYVGEQVNQLQEIVETNISSIREEIDEKFDNIADVVDNNIEYFNQKLEETSIQVKKTTETYTNISKILENKVSQENEKFEEYSELIEDLSQAFEQLALVLKEELYSSSQFIEEKFEDYKKEFEDISSNLEASVDDRLEDYHKEILDIKADVVISEQHIKNVDKYIQEHYQELIELKEEVFTEIEKLPVGNLQENIERLEKKIDYIKETYSKIEPEVVVKEVIKEGLLNEPPQTDNSDPLTPLDQKFVTLDQLQEHYRLFINRIQQQLSTIGGGGETRLKYLDDIVGIATNASAYDGKYLKYNHSLGKFEFADVDVSNDSWADGALGPYTFGSVGIGTSVSKSALDVRGDITLGTSGINTISSTTDIQSWYYTNKSKSVTTDDGIPNAVYVGASGTAMFIIGDANNRVIQYTLSTPYDVSTAGAATTFFSTATQETVPTGIDFNSTGTKMFVSGQTGVAPLIAGGEYVHEYSLSTPWNVAPTSVGWTTSYNVTAQDTAPQGVAFGDSGSKMYVVGSTNDTVYQYSLSTPYSLASGVTYDNKSLAVGSVTPFGETLPTDISFNSSGTSLWVIGQTNDRIYEFRLSTPWDISTAVFYDDVYVGFTELTTTGLHVIPEQNVAYIVGSGSDIVYQYSTNTPALEIASSGISSESSIVLNNETRVKDKLYVKGLAHFDTSIVTQGSIQVDSNITVSGGSIGVGNVAATLLGGNTTTNITFGSGLTSGTLQIGSAAGTGTINVGLSTASQTTNIQTGAAPSGIQKTINVGTGGLSGSRTLITVGSATAGAISTVSINPGTNLILGLTTPTPTGTSLQPLQVGSASSIQGAYVSGSVGIGTTNPTSPLHVIGSTLITGIATVGLANTSTPPSNSQLSFELISNTQLRIKVRGTDGVLRSADITLA